MNVLNRKMFANREARRKLANMGGIVASSPETLSVAQAYAPGGQVSGDRYIISVPGVLNGVGEYLEVSAQTLQRLNDVMPEVMMRAAQGENSGFVSDVETARRTNSRIATAARPGDAVVQTRLSRLASPETPASPAPVQDDRTIRDVVREGLASSYSVGPIEALMNQINAQGPVPSPTGYGDIKPGQGYDAASLFGDGNIFTNEGTRAGGPGIVVPPPELTVQNRTVDTPAFQELQRQLAEQRTEVPGFNMPGESTPYEMDPTAALAAGESMSIGDQMLNLGFTGGDIDPSAVGPQLDPVAQAREDEINALLSVFDDPNRTEAQVKAARQRLEQIGAKDRIISTVSETLEGAGEAIKNRIASDAADIYGTLGTGANLLGSTDTATALFEAQKEAEAKREAATAASVAEVEAEQEARRPRSGPPTRGGPAKVREEEPADGGDLDAQSNDLSSAVEKIVTNPDATPGEKNDQTAKTVISGLTGTDTSNMDTKELVNYYKDLFSEMLGESDEDKAEEKWLNMAMIGFAIASGESPSALQNIAGGLLEGTSMMMDQRAEDRKREDTITTLAIEQALGREKEERELERLSRKRTADIEDALAEYEGKQIIKQKYTTITKDEPQWSKDLTRAFTAALSDMGGDFDAALTQIKKSYTPEAINIWMNSKQMITDDGTGPIVQQQTLDDIPD